MKHNLIVTIGGLILAAVMGYYGIGKLGPNDNLPTWLLSAVDTAKDQFPADQTANQTVSNNQPTGQQNNATRVGGRSQILIGTFNIQVFGTSKIQDAEVVEKLLDIAKRFDVLAVQELRAIDQSVVPQFIAELNRRYGLRFNFLIGPRQGDTQSKEQYVYVYNSDIVQPVQNPWVINDPTRRFHRAPMIATFRCRLPAEPGAHLRDSGLPDSQMARPFQFSLANIHTDPDVAEDEINSLAEMFRQLQGSQFVDDDLIILGDFNAGPDRFGQLARIPGITAVIPAQTATNLAGTRCYDNIVFDRRFTTEFNGQAGVFNFLEAYKPYGMNYELAKRVSDHFPVWAVFSIYESDANSNLANQSWPPVSR